MYKEYTFDIRVKIKAESEEDARNHAEFVAAGISRANRDTIHATGVQYIPTS